MLGGFTQANTFNSHNFEDTEAKKLCKSFKVTQLGMLESGLKLSLDSRTWPFPPGQASY